MKLILYPRDYLQARWQQDLKCFESGTTSPPRCLRCGKPLENDLFHNKLSRYLQITICGACGDDEAFRCYAGNPLPLEKWHAVESESIKPTADPQTAIIRSLCGFKQVFENVVKMPHSGIGQPESLVVYSRSDYDGYRWHTTWFDGPAPRPENKLVQEIDQFQNALFGLPEMKSLTSMEQLRHFAEPTNDSTEYNLYSETEHFYIWIRLIYRPRDYNLRVHFYRK